MAFWKDKFRKDNYEEDDDRQYQGQEEDSRTSDSYSEPEFVQRPSRVYTEAEGNKFMDQSEQVNMVIFKPTEYEQAQTIIDYLKCKKPIIVNLDEIEVSIAQRILDFITGAVYALSGDIKKAARNIFVVVPSNVGISNADDDKNMSADNGANSVGGEDY